MALSERARGHRQCPQCGSTDIVPIRYGLPSPAGEEDFREGRVVWGGCVVAPSNPVGECRVCGAAIHKPPQSERR